MDPVNAFFEFASSFFLLISVFKVHREKRVAGISYIHVGFFALWGVWNLFYYPYLGQSYSFYAGIFLVIVNVTYFGQLVYYDKLYPGHPRRTLQSYRESGKQSIYMV